MDFSFSDLNFNSVVTDNVAILPSIENLPGFEARAAFLCYGKALRSNPVNSASVFREDVGIAPTVVVNTLYIGTERFPYHDTFALSVSGVL